MLKLFIDENEKKIAGDKMCCLYINKTVICSDVNKM